MRVCVAVAVLVGAFAAVGSHRASAATIAAQGDFAGLVDIGHGRRIYLECRGFPRGSGPRTFARQERHG